MDIYRQVNKLNPQVKCGIKQVALNSFHSFRILRCLEEKQLGAARGICKADAGCDRAERGGARFWGGDRD